MKKLLAVLLLVPSLVWANPNLVQTQSLQTTSEVGATSNRQITLKNGTAGSAGLLTDVTTSGGNGMTQEWKIDGTTKVEYGTFLGGAFTGFLDPTSTQIFFGLGDASSYVLLASGTINMGGAVACGALSVGSLTDSGLTSGRVTIASTSGLLADDADLTFATDTLIATKIKVKQGTGSSTANVGGVIFDHFADAGNVGTGDDDLYSDTIPANAFGTNGDKVVSRYQGIFVGAVTSTQRLRVYFGGTNVYDSGALTIGAATNNWTVDVTVIRESSSVVRVSVEVNTDFATLFPYSTYTRITGLTLSNTQILKITGEAAGAAAANDQIVAKLGYVNFEPAA